jgi:hypothetical protein
MNEAESQTCNMPQASDQKDEIVKPLLFSRHQIGKNRWFWVVGQFMEDPLGSGISNSPEEAFSEAQRTFGNLLMNRNWQARGEWIKRRAIERSKAESSATNAAAMEFAYECHDYVSDYPGDDGHCVTPHRIVKRTKARIYVEQEPFRENSSPTDEWWHWHQPTFVLDRAEFERTGKARGNRRRYYDTYYVSPDVYFAEVRTNSRPECFEKLGVDPGASEKEVKIAYFRLAKAAHPDAGGNIEQFKELQKAFEDALIIARRNDAEEQVC